jgi:hypothetical protein
MKCLVCGAAGHTDMTCAKAFELRAAPQGHDEAEIFSQHEKPQGNTGDEICYPAEEEIEEEYHERHKLDAAAVDGTWTVEDKQRYRIEELEEE